MTRRYEVFATAPDAVQLVWRGTGHGRDELELAGRTRVVEPTDTVGAWTVRGLAPDTSHVVRRNGRRLLTARTARRPDGALLGRVATVSDLHVGETGVGHWPRVRSVRTLAQWRDAHPVWCLEAALAELTAWGPELLVVKGDLAHDNRQDQYDLTVPLLQRSGVPLLVIGGNHDGGNHSEVDFEAAMARAGHVVPPGVQERRIGAATVLVADTRVDGSHAGTTERIRDELCERAGRAAAEGPVLVFVHHQFMTTRFPYYLPGGIPKHDADRFLAALAQAAPQAFVSSGHTHRNRARRHGGLTLTEVGSPKDYPGVWAAYELYERGIVQTLYRVEEPRALAWNDLTRTTARGVWARWAPGTLADRCVTVAW